MNRDMTGVANPHFIPRSIPPTVLDLDDVMRHKPRSVYQAGPTSPGAMNSGTYTTYRAIRG